MRIVQFLTEAEEIYYDESFQRPAGCWTDKNHNGYIEDVFYGFELIILNIWLYEIFKNKFNPNELNKNIIQ